MDGITGRREHPTLYGHEDYWESPKKVEENNFELERLLEYDDVMNSQRTIIYTLRKNALKGKVKNWYFKYAFRYNSKNCNDKQKFKWL